MKIISFRVEEYQFDYIKKCSQLSGLNMSEYCRRVLLDQKVENTFSKQRIGDLLCRYYNYIADINETDRLKQLLRELGVLIWQHIG